MKVPVNSYMAQQKKKKKARDAYTLNEMLFFLALKEEKNLSHVYLLL